MSRTALAALAICWATSVSAVGFAAEWSWRPVLSAPRIGGRLWSLAVDARDPRRIFVGTEEGTLVRSTDGGNSWTEHELSPLVVEQTQVGLQGPGLPELGESPPKIFVAYPPYIDYADYPRYLDWKTPDHFVLPDIFTLRVRPTINDPEASLLYDVMREPTRSPTPVVRIALCDGFRWPLVAATTSELFGSDDDGLTFMRLFAVSGGEAIADVVCSPVDRGVIALATDVGMFVSKDGGATFDPTSGLWPGEPASAVAFDREGELYAADGETLYSGQPGSELSEIYPAAHDSDTTPWLDIRSIELVSESDEDPLAELRSEDGSACGRKRRVARRKKPKIPPDLVPPSQDESVTPPSEATASDAMSLPEIWIATDGGIRRRDSAGRWTRVPSLEGEATTQVRAGRSPEGRRRIAAMTREYVFSSDDGGATWTPFFHGMTPRTYRWLASVEGGASRPSVWYLLTSGELWTTAPLAPRPPRGPDPIELQRWATSRLESAEPLDLVVGDVLDRVGLSNEVIASVHARADAKNWLPYVDVFFDWAKNADSGRVDRQGLLVQTNLEATTDSVYFFWVQFSWWWDPPEELQAREELHQLRKRISFAAGDVWRERISVLTELSSGRGSPFELEAMRTRVIALDALLDIWRGRGSSRGVQP
ncbi:MAG: hypothetical protein HY791_21880 [Deltaproteobacteria bacterium]|nr:hypothetical protein [Deltaproteobacteria bacterium]